MNNLQNLIETIVESKVRTALEEGNKENKAKKNKVIAGIGRTKLKGGRGSNKAALQAGRAHTKPLAPPINPPKSFPDADAVSDSEDIETGKYSKRHTGGVMRMATKLLAGLGKHRLNPIKGPKGKLP